MFHKPCFAATGEVFEQNRQLLLVGREKYLDFFTNRLVVGFVANKIFLGMKGVWSTWHFPEVSDAGIVGE